eukprot:272218_1
MRNNSNTNDAKFIPDKDIQCIKSGTFSKNDKRSFVFAKSAKQELKILAIIWIKISIQSLLSLIPKVLGAIFVGNIQDGNSAQLLSAVGFAMNFSNITGMTIGWGFTSGLLTLIPQSIGSNRMDLIAEHTQRAFYVVLIVLIMSTIIQFYSGDILCKILKYNNTPNEIMCDYITMYCVYLIPFLYFITWFSILKRVIQNLRYNSELLLIIFVSNVTTPFSNWLFVYYLNIGYLGAAITININMFFSVLLCVLFLCYKGHSNVFIPLPIRIVMKYSAVKEYLQLTLPGLFSVCSSWWIGEIVIIVSGLIANPTISVATMVICYSVYEILLWISIALGNSVNIRIGKYIGYGSIIYAQKVAKIASLLNLIFDVSIILFLSLLKDYIPKLYANNNQVIEQTSQLMYCIVLVLITASIFRVLDGIFYGLGYPMTVAIVVFIAQDIVAIGSIFVCLFEFDYKNYTNLALHFIWICIGCGFLIASIVLIIVLMCKRNTIWKNAVHASMMRIKMINSLPTKPLIQPENVFVKYGAVVFVKLLSK